MNFLYPGFLFALLAVAIPILVHLFNFRKFKKVYFSNVQFLQEAEEQNSSTQKLKNLLILACRILAIVFLVLAFARPFIQGASSVNPSVRNSITIYVDNSYSMESVNKEGSLLDEAKRKVKGIVGAYNINDQFRLLTNDFEGKHERFVGKEEFIQSLEEVKISSVSRSLQQVVNRLQQAGSGKENAVGFIVSDFQKPFSGEKKIKTVGDMRFSLVKLNANTLPNISVDSLWSLSATHQPGGEEKFVVQLKNYSESDAPGVPVKLSINNQQKSLSNVKIKAGESVRDTLTFSGLKKGWQKGTVSIKDFPLTFDDGLRFSFEVQDHLKVLNITGDPSEKHIKAVFNSDSFFRLTEMPENNIKYSSLPDYSVIVLNSLKSPSNGLAQQLKNFIDNGGSVVIFPDLDADLQVYSEFLSGLSLPVISELYKGEKIGTSADLKHPLFKDVFEEIPRNLDLPVVTRYLRLRESNTTKRRAILSVPVNQTLFSEYTVGSGKVFLSSSSLDVKDNSLPNHPIFLPLLYRIAFSSVQEQPLYYTMGEDNLLEYKQINLGVNQTLRLTSDKLEVIPEMRQVPGKTLLYIADQVKAAGYYDLKQSDSLLAAVAFNDNRKESDMHFATDVELEKLFDKNKISVQDSKADTSSAFLAQQNSSKELWKLCLILTIVFLMVEVLLIKFFDKTKNNIKT